MQLFHRPRHPGSLKPSSPGKAPANGPSARRVWKGQKKLQRVSQGGSVGGEIKDRQSRKEKGGREGTK